MAEFLRGVFFGKKEETKVVRPVIQEALKALGFKMERREEKVKKAVDACVEKCQEGKVDDLLKPYRKLPPEVRCGRQPFLIFESLSDSGGDSYPKRVYLAKGREWRRWVINFVYKVNKVDGVFLGNVVKQEGGGVEFKPYENKELFPTKFFLQTDALREKTCLSLVSI